MTRLLLLMAVAGVVLAPGVAVAYPQWQFSSGTARCGQCHFNPSGGGPITTYARDAVGEELSSFEGDGAFLHGAVELPDWLALQADFRGAFMRHENSDPEGTRTALFPMQADLYGRAVLPAGLSLIASVGYRGQARSSPGPIHEGNYQPRAVNRLVSREHYLMWRQGGRGFYARGGRFFAPFGLRLAEHHTYVRSDLGYDQLQESYGAGGGYIGDLWEAHVTGFAFAPDGLSERGGAGIFEYRLLDAIALGASGRFGMSDDMTRAMGGLFSRVWVDKINTMLMLEGNLVNEKGTEGGAANKLVGYGGLTFFPFRGMWLSGYGEVSQTDIRVKDTAVKAINGQINWLPYPHFELLFLGRIQTAPGTDPVRTALFMAHYYL